MVRPDDGGGSNGGGSDSTAGESSASDQSAGEQPGGQNLAAYFTRHADDDVALITPSGEITYGQLGARIKDWRCRLTAAGVKRGDRVVIMTGNNVDFVTVHVASIGLGAASVPLNHESPAAELIPQLTVVDPKAVYVGDDAASVWSQVGDEFQERRIDPSAEVDPSVDPGVVAVTPDTPALLVFTSGTAGTSKAAILTHANLLASLQAVLSLPIDLVQSPQTLLAIIPLFHIFGVHMVVHLGLITGSKLILEDYENATRMMELIRTRRPTLVAGPPALWQRVVDQGGQATDFSSVKLAVSGAAALPPKLAVAVDDQFGLVLHDGYGLTETSAVAASTIGVDDPPLGSVGLLMPGIEARLVDTDGSDCLVGDPGEIWLKGPMVSPGYWGESTAHASRTEDGWLRTGDVAVVDDDGYLAIVGREKDLIIVSGFNVFPAEVEAALRSHPSVAQVGVVGEPLEATGEAVVAFVVPAEGVDIDENELWRHCREQLARYKVPHRFVIAENLPVGPSGKLRRNRLIPGNPLAGGGQ